MSAFGTPSTAEVYPNPNNDYTILPAINDGIHDLSWSPTANVLVAGSWDNCVRCWEVHQHGKALNAVPQVVISHDGPVLCTAFSEDGSVVFSGSCDRTAKMWVLSGPPQGYQIAQHDAPIRCIASIQSASCVVTGSWDKTLKYWDTRSATPLATVQLSERCYAMDVKSSLVVVGTADRQVYVFDIRKPSVVYKSIQSKLKYQTRAIALFPDATGFAVVSIEGRCAIQHIDENDKKHDYTFRCHRDGSNVYPVSSISFHPFGTVSTTGADGSYCFWDIQARQKLKTFAKVDQSITVGKFNACGDMFAYALSYDWSMGSEKYNPNQPSVIRLHNVAEAEIKQKKKPGARSSY